MAGDGRLLERFRSEELLPIGSRMRVRLAIECTGQTSKASRRRSLATPAPPEADERSQTRMHQRVFQRDRQYSNRLCQNTSRASHWPRCLKVDRMCPKRQ
jgi:hypothetical protein